MHVSAAGPPPLAPCQGRPTEAPRPSTGGPVLPLALPFGEKGKTGSRCALIEHLPHLCRTWYMASDVQLFILTLSDDL